MKKFAIAAVVLAMVAGAGLRAYLHTTKLEAQKEVAAIVGATYKTMRINARPASQNLLRLAERNPEFVFVCWATEHAVADWPYIKKDVGDAILREALNDEHSALNHLRLCLSDAVSDSIKKEGRGKDPASPSVRIGWVNNNPATAMLFLEWPVAEKLDKRAEYVACQIKGTREKPYWHEPVVTLEQMQHWWWGKWPLAGEAPVY